MEAVPAASGVRRTVRLAAALVVGQVLLVAIVGWVTLTRGDGHPARGAAAVDQLAAPPAHVPPVPLAPPATPATKKPPATEKPAAKKTAAGARAHATPGGPEARFGKSRSTPVPPAPATSTSSGPLSLVPTSSPAAIPPSVSPAATPSAPASAPASAPGSASPAPVRPGEPCGLINEVARADDGRMVRCLPTRSDQLRWKIV